LDLVSNDVFPPVVDRGPAGNPDQIGLEIELGHVGRSYLYANVYDTSQKKGKQQTTEPTFAPHDEITSSGPKIVPFAAQKEPLS